MRPTIIYAAFLAIVATHIPATGQHIIAQTTGLANPNHLIDFGSGLYPNTTVITNQFPGITVSHARYWTTGSVNNIVGGFLTNDFSGAPNTLKIKFTAPITDVSLVYHQISTVQPSVFRILLAGTVVDTFSNLSNQTQPNNYFGFSNTLFDEFQIDFVSDFNIDSLAYNDSGAAYCLQRNGTNVNAIDYHCQTQPVIGAVWQSTIATKPLTVNTYLAFGLAGPHPGLPFAGGELLIALSPAPIVIPALGFHLIPIPATMPGGTILATQGMRLDLVGGVPTLVLLNAIDLYLGT